MSASRQAVVDQYVTALRDYVANPEEVNLERAYALSRRVIGDKRAMLDLVTIHHRELAAIVRTAATPDDRDRTIGLASAFFGESLSSLAMAQQGFLDTVERQRSEAEGRAETAERAVHERDTFLSIAAHELKTPLTGLRGFTQLLLRSLRRPSAPDPEALSQVAQRIERQTQKLGRLIDRLLDLSRLQAGCLQLEWSDIDLVELTAEVVAAAQALTTAHHVVVTSPRILRVRADPTRLDQVLTNLIDNAVKYSPCGGTIAVTVGERTDRGTVWLAVQDQGIGVPEERRAYLFNRYYQAHAQGYQSGLGLGLYISHEIIAQHGGRLEAEFPPEGGSRFIVTLPTTPAPLDPPVA